MANAVTFRHEELLLTLKPRQRVKCRTSEDLQEFRG
jgi:hypothetical protein